MSRKKMQDLVGKVVRYVIDPKQPRMKMEGVLVRLEGSTPIVKLSSGEEVKVCTKWELAKERMTP